jgi:hypothetical protein
LGFRIANAALFRIEDGKVVDEWPRTDMLGLTHPPLVIDIIVNTGVVDLLEPVVLFVLDHWTR